MNSIKEKNFIKIHLTLFGFGFSDRLGNTDWYKTETKYFKMFNSLK